MRDNQFALAFQAREFVYQQHRKDQQFVGNGQPSNSVSRQKSNKEDRELRWRCGYSRRAVAVVQSSRETGTCTNASATNSVSSLVHCREQMLLFFANVDYLGWCREAQQSEGSLCVKQQDKRLVRN